MGRIAEVISYALTSDDAGHGADVKCDPGGNPVEAPHWGPAGDDGPPLPGDSVCLQDSDGSGSEDAVGYADTRNAGKAAPGEKRIYARDSSGATVCEVWLKGDGAIVVSNDSGSFEMAPSGAVTINGVVIGTDGSVKAPGEVSAMAATPATVVSLSKHMHPTAVGPTGPPTPGT